MGAKLAVCTCEVWCYVRCEVLAKFDAKFGACGIWGTQEGVQRLLHETMPLAEARPVQHALGESMPS